MTSAKKHFLLETDFLEEAIILSAVPPIREAMNKLSMSVVLIKTPAVVSFFNPQTDVTGAIEMVSSKYRGHLHLHFNQNVLFKSLELLINVKHTALNKDVFEAVSEFTNTTYGILKSALNSHGHDFGLAIPTAGLTEHFKTGSISAKRLVVPFIIYGQVNFIEIFLEERI